MIISVELTQAESDAIEAIAAEIAPELTPAELVTWAEEQAKAGLIHAVAQKAVTFRWQQLENDFPGLFSAEPTP